MIVQTSNDTVNGQGQKRGTSMTNLEETILEETLHIKRERTEGATLHSEFIQPKSGAEQEHCHNAGNVSGTDDASLRYSDSEDFEFSAQTLCRISVPKPFFDLAVATILRCSLLPRVQLHDLTSMKNSLAEVRRELQSREMPESRLETVMSCLRRDAGKVFADLASAAMGSADDQREETSTSAPRQTEMPVTPASKDSATRRVRSTKEARLASPQSAHGLQSTPSRVAARPGASERRLQYVTAQSSHEHSPVGLHTANNATESRSAVHQNSETSPESARLLSRFWHTGPGTDARDSEHSDDGAPSPTGDKPKKRVWSEREENLLLEGMRLQHSPSRIAQRMVAEGLNRSISAMENRRSYLKKKYPVSSWREEPANHIRPQQTMRSMSSDRISSGLPGPLKRKKVAVANSSQSDSTISSGLALTPGPRSTNTGATLTKINWVVCLCPPTDIETHVLYLPINTLDGPASPVTHETVLDLEQACIDALKTNEHSFQSVERLADDFWILRCKAQVSPRSIMECPIEFGGFTFFAEYLPLKAPRTFSADVSHISPTREQRRSMHLQFASLKVPVQLKTQVDLDSSTRRIVAYFDEPPGLMRFYITAGQYLITFKPVEMFGTCWLCCQPHGDRVCAQATSMEIDSDKI